MEARLILWKMSFRYEEIRERNAEDALKHSATAKWQRAGQVAWENRWRRRSRKIGGTHFFQVLQPEICIGISILKYVGSLPLERAGAVTNQSRVESVILCRTSLRVSTATDFIGRPPTC